MWAVSELFRAAEIQPLTTVARKDLASEALFVPGRSGTPVLDINTVWVCVIGQFALLLEERHATGEVWMDRLGSPSEEVRRQQAWEQLRDGPWPFDPRSQAMLRRIAPSLAFYDSRTEPLVQIADVLSGVIWAASEGDDDFLRASLAQYFPIGPSTYTFLHAE